MSEEKQNIWRQMDLFTYCDTNKVQINQFVSYCGSSKSSILLLLVEWDNPSGLDWKLCFPCSMILVNQDSPQDMSGNWWQRFAEHQFYYFF